MRISSRTVALMKLGGWNLLAACVFILASCDSSETASDKNTNWLGGCRTTGDCRTGLECIHGICTRTCVTDAGCVGLSVDAVCAAAPRTETCLAPLPPVCTLRCTGTTSCRGPGERLLCRGDACFPSACSEAGAPEGGSETALPGADATADVRPEASAPESASGTPPPDSTVAPADARPDASDCGAGGCSPPPDAGTRVPFDIVTGRQAPYRIVSDGESVFWTDLGPVGTPAGSMILKCPVTGCQGAPTILATSSEADWAMDITVSNGVVYWVTPNSGQVLKCAASGCNGTPTPIATSQSFPTAVAVSATDVFWSTETGTEPDSIMRCPLPDCPGGPVVVASGQFSPQGIATDGVSAFWTNLGWGGVPDDTNGSVVVCDNAAAGCGTTATVLVTFPKLNARRIAIDATHVVWTHYDASVVERDGRVYACARSGCNGAPEVVATGQADPWDIVLDSGFAYWPNYTISDVEPMGENVHSILRCPIVGCGSRPEVIAKDQAQPRGIAVDANRVYWTSFGKGAIVGMRK